MNTNGLNTLEAIEDLNDIDLFADELEDHYSHSVPISTLGCISTMLVCICTFSTICYSGGEEPLPGDEIQN